MTYSLEIIIFYILQQTPNFIPAVFGIKPLLLLPILIMIALFEGEQIALCFGIFIGILLDVSFSWSLGFYTVAMPLVGYIIGYISRNLAKNTVLTAMIISTIFVLLTYSLHFLIYFVFGGYTERSYAYLRHYLPSCAYTLSTSLLFYYFNRAFASIIREEKPAA